MASRSGSEKASSFRNLPQPYCFGWVLGFGFVRSALLLSGLLIVIALLHFFTKVSGVLLFWLAFVLTRPFGATFGDFLTKPIEKGGIHVGTVGSSIVFCVILLVAIAKETQLEKRRWLAYGRND